MAAGDYCAVCGEAASGVIAVVLDDREVHLCDEHGDLVIGLQVCAEAVMDGLSCALPKGHDGAHRLACRDLGCAPPPALWSARPEPDA